jgi:hypothetical protein
LRCVCEREGALLASSTCAQGGLGEYSAEIPCKTAFGALIEPPRGSWAQATPPEVRAHPGCLAWPPPLPGGRVARPGPLPWWFGA